MTTSTQAPQRAERHERLRGRHALAALAGLLSAAVALGVAELVAALVGPASSPVIAVGDAAITLTPEDDILGYEQARPAFLPTKV